MKFAWERQSGQLRAIRAKRTCRPQLKHVRGWARAFRVAFVRDSVFGTAEILVLEGARGVDVHQYGTACQ